MSQFSKNTLKKINLHLETLKSSKRSYQENYNQSKDNNLTHISVLSRNKTLGKMLLMESNLLDFESITLSNKNVALTNKLLLKNKNRFINKNSYRKSYLLYKNYNGTNSYNQKLIYLLTKVLYSSKEAGEQILNNYKNLTENNKSLKKLLFIRDSKYSKIISLKNIKGWYIYLARFLTISLLHFIPFIQLTTTLFYNQPNKQIVHPILSSLFNITPFLVPLINLTTPLVNQDTISFLLLVPYLYFFIYSFRKYNISRKIAYQGSFALALMLFRYSLILSQEALTVIYKFTKRFFFLKKYKEIDLLRDDINFYIDDLEEMRNYKEDFFQLGESIFSLDDTTKITRVWEATTLFSLLGVIALLYNYMYFILRGQKPIIPIVTKTVQRMMIDRKGKES